MVSHESRVQKRVVEQVNRSGLVFLLAELNQLSLFDQVSARDDESVRGRAHLVLNLTQLFHRIVVRDVLVDLLSLLLDLLERLRDQVFDSFVLIPLQVQLEIKRQSGN